MCLWQTDLCACRTGSQFACCKALLLLTVFLTKLSLSLLTLHFYQCHPAVQAHSWDYSDPGPRPAFCQIISRCCGRPLFCYFQLLLCVCMYQWHVWVMPPLMYSWPAAHLCDAGWRGQDIPSPTPSTSLGFWSSLTPFPFPLHPFLSFLSHSCQPQVCVGLSHASALVRWALLSVKPQTWDMRNGKWENRHLHKSWQTHTCTRTHTIYVQGVI